METLEKKNVNWKVLEREAATVKYVRTLVDQVLSTQKAQAENVNLPDKMFVEEVAMWKNRLRNEFGLLYSQAECIVEEDEWKAFLELLKKVRKAMPEYVKKLPKIKSPV